MKLSFRQFSSVQSLSPVRLCDPMNRSTPSLPVHQTRSSLRLTSIESATPSSHLILCRPLLLLPSISPSIRVFSNESTLRMRWPKYWSFSFSIIPSKKIPGLISKRSNYQSKVERGLFQRNFHLRWLVEWALFLYSGSPQSF